MLPASHQPAAVRGNLPPPPPRRLFRIADLAGQICAPHWGVVGEGLGSLSSLHLIHSAAKHVCCVFHKTSDVDCICAIPRHAHTEANTISFPVHTSLCTTPPLFSLPVTSPLSGAYLPTGRHGESQCTSLTDVAQTARSLFRTFLPSSRPLSSTLCLSVPHRSHTS